MIVISIAASLIAVSYTHLDVYKRQQVRCALTAVIKRQFGDNSNCDKNGWLRFGFNGKQVGVAEDYSNTGSLYLCTTGFLPLGPVSYTHLNSFKLP